jgi:hypothetical protein
MNCAVNAVVCEVHPGVFRLVLPSRVYSAPTRLLFSASGAQGKRDESQRAPVLYAFEKSPGSLGRSPVKVLAITQGFSPHERHDEVFDSFAYGFQW